MPKITKLRKGKGNIKVKLTQGMIDTIVNCLRLGSYIETAAILAGIDKNTFYAWLKKGRAKPRSMYGKLLRSVLVAQQEAKIRDLTIIDKAANGRPAKFMRDENGKIMFNDKGRALIEEESLEPDWSASAWRLERRFPKEWGRSDKNVVELDVILDEGDELTDKDIEKNNKDLSERVERLKKLLKESK